MCRLGLLRRWILVVAGVLSIPPAACAGFEIVSHSAFADAATHEVVFHITFNQPPDFFTANSDDNPLNAFQYFYDSDPGGFEFAGEDVAIIRGPEIRFHNKIPIRDSLNLTGEDFPHAEGWGKQRGLVSFDLDGAVL